MRKARTRQGAFTQDGYALAVVMMCIALVSVGITGAALSATYGVLSAARTRRTVDTRMAVTARAADDVPAENGGSIAPSTPIEGFYDYATIDPKTGRLASYTASDAPSTGDLVLRQWRVSANASGGRLFEVSGVLVDAASKRPLEGARGARFVLSRVAE